MHQFLRVGLGLHLECCISGGRRLYASHPGFLFLLFFAPAEIGALNRLHGVLEPLPLKNLSMEEPLATSAKPGAKRPAPNE